MNEAIEGIEEPAKSRMVLVDALFLINSLTTIIADSFFTALGSINNKKHGFAIHVFQPEKFQKSVFSCSSYTN